MNTTTIPEQLQLNLINDAVNTTIVDLNRKAMLVKLTQRKPTLTKRNVMDESAVQQFLGDSGAKLFGEIFIDKGGSVRAVINAASAEYQYHKKHTLAYEDRGPRLLPVTQYETYRDSMRKLQADKDAMLKAMLPNYDGHVLDDIQRRNDAATYAGRTPKASITDYPTAEQFEQAMYSAVKFSQLPDASHWLFDASPEDKAELTAQLIDQLAEAGAQAQQEMFTRVRVPLTKMLDKLRIPQGEPGSIFRDTLVTNLHEEVELVRSMAMGDATILSMCDEVESATTGHARNPQVLRDSPIVREQTVARLEEVQKKMNFMFGGV